MSPAFISHKPICMQINFGDLQIKCLLLSPASKSLLKLQPKQFKYGVNVNGKYVILQPYEKINTSIHYMLFNESKEINKH